MTEPFVAQLRADICPAHEKYPHGQDCITMCLLRLEAADRIEELEDERRRAQAAYDALRKAQRQLLALNNAVRGIERTVGMLPPRANDLLKAKYTASATENVK